MLLKAGFKQDNLKFLAGGKENFSGSVKDWYDFAKKCERSSQKGWSFVKGDPKPGDILINYPRPGNSNGHVMISMGTPQEDGRLRMADITTPVRDTTSSHGAGDADRTKKNMGKGYVRVDKSKGGWKMGWSPNDPNLTELNILRPLGLSKD